MTQKSRFFQNAKSLSREDMRNYQSASIPFVKREDDQRLTKYLGTFSQSKFGGLIVDLFQDVTNGELRAYCLAMQKCYVDIQAQNMFHRQKEFDEKYKDIVQFVDKIEHDANKIFKQIQQLDKKNLDKKKNARAFLILGCVFAGWSLLNLLLPVIGAGLFATIVAIIPSVVGIIASFFALVLGGGKETVYDPVTQASKEVFVLFAFVLLTFMTVAIWSGVFAGVLPGMQIFALITAAIALASFVASFVFALQAKHAANCFEDKRDDLLEKEGEENDPESMYSKLKDEFDKVKEQFNEIVYGDPNAKSDGQGEADDRDTGLLSFSMQVS